MSDNSSDKKEWFAQTKGGELAYDIWKGYAAHSFSRVAKRKLNMLEAAYALNDLRVPPGNHLEKLTGNRAGQYSIRINEQWGICFMWKSDGGAQAYAVEIVDYH